MASASRRPVIGGTEAQAFVADVRAACAFYTAKLGFAVAFCYGEPPFYAQVRRDRALLNLRAIGEPVYAGDVREREKLLTATFTLGTRTALERLANTYQAADVSFDQPLRAEPWGAMTFVVCDPDGNLVLFAAPAE